MRYRMVKTTLGHKYRMREAEDSLAERILFWAGASLLTFVSAAGMALMWFKGV